MEATDDTGRVLKFSCHLITCPQGHHAVVMMIENISTEERADLIGEWLRDVLLTAMGETNSPLKQTTLN